MTTLPRSTLLAGVLLLGGALMAPTVFAHGDEVHLTLEAGEGDACGSEDNFCFEATSGDLSKVTAGATVDLTLENPTGNEIRHNAHVADMADASKGQDTPASAAFANTSDVSPGESGSASFTVPDGADSTYIWCTIGAHEQGGMWLAAGDAAAGGGGDGHDDGANGSPGFTAVAALGAVGAALVLAHRRD